MVKIYIYIYPRRLTLTWNTLQSLKPKALLFRTIIFRVQILVFQGVSLYWNDERTRRVMLWHWKCRFLVPSINSGVRKCIKQQERSWNLWRRRSWVARIVAWLWIVFFFPAFYAFGHPYKKWIQMRVQLWVKYWPILSVRFLNRN